MNAHMPSVETSIYRLRFSDEELRQARAFWVPICRYLERFMSSSGATLDLGAGYCHFINTVQSVRKYALDVNRENLDRWAHPGVIRIVASGNRLDMLEDDSLDTVFASNVYEHFHTKDDCAESFREVCRVLRPGGRFLILQPNFAYSGPKYFDFFDHRQIFTHRGMAEGLEMSGFRLVHVIPQFLPYTSKSAVPKAAWLVRLYLALPWIWRLVGAQMLLVAEKPSP